MPLWIIYHAPETFTSPSTKQSLAENITKIYSSLNLPPFYVNVFFIPVPSDSLYIGGESRPSSKSSLGSGQDTSRPWIRVTIQNIARSIPNAAIAKRFLDKVDEVLKPFIADQGYDWEYSVEETSRDLWKMNGLIPPMPGSNAEKHWFKTNRAEPYDPAAGELSEENGGVGSGGTWAEKGRL